MKEAEAKEEELQVPVRLEEQQQEQTATAQDRESFARALLLGSSLPRHGQLELVRRLQGLLAQSETGATLPPVEHKEREHDHDEWRDDEPGAATPAAGHIENPRLLPDFPLLSVMAQGLPTLETTAGPRPMEPIFKLHRDHICRRVARLPWLGTVFSLCVLLAIPAHMVGTGESVSFGMLWGSLFVWWVAMGTFAVMFLMADSKVARHVILSFDAIIIQLSIVILAVCEWILIIPHRHRIGSSNGVMIATWFWAVSDLVCSWMGGIYFALLPDAMVLTNKGMRRTLVLLGAMFMLCTLLYQIFLNPISDQVWCADESFVENANFCQSAASGARVAAAQVFIFLCKVAWRLFNDGNAAIFVRAPVRIRVLVPG